MNSKSIYKAGKYTSLFLSILLLCSCSSEYSDNQNFILADGLYHIKSYPKELELGTGFDQVDSLDIVTYGIRDQNQIAHWKIRHLEGKEYKIQAIDLKKFLTLVDGKIFLSEESNNETQSWFIHKYKDQKFKIINKSLMTCLCLPDKDAKQNVLTIRNCNNRTGEYWSIDYITAE